MAKPFSVLPATAEWRGGRWPEWAGQSLCGGLTSREVPPGPTSPPGGPIALARESWGHPPIGGDGHGIFFLAGTSRAGLNGSRDRGASQMTPMVRERVELRPGWVCQLVKTRRGVGTYLPLSPRLV